MRSVYLKTITMFTPLFLVCCSQTDVITSTQTDVITSTQTDVITSTQTDVITINYPPINGLKISAELVKQSFHGPDTAVLILDDQRIDITHDGTWPLGGDLDGPPRVYERFSELPSVIDWGGPNDAVGTHPFSLVDFNFDGKYELLIELNGGGNRDANRYIVIGYDYSRDLVHYDDGLVQWDNAPFNDLHAGGEIDLEKKEIQTWGSGGACEWERVYWRWYPEYEQWLVHKKETAYSVFGSSSGCWIEEWKVQHTFHPDDN